MLKVDTCQVVHGLWEHGGGSKMFTSRKGINETSQEIPLLSISTSRGGGRDAGKGAVSPVRRDFETHGECVKTMVTTIRLWAFGAPCALSAFPVVRQFRKLLTEKR